MTGLILLGVALAAGLSAWTVLHFLDFLLQAQKNSLKRTAGQTLAEMFIFVDPQVLWRASMMSALVVPVLLYAVTGAPVLPVASFIIILVAPKAGVAWLKKRRITKFESQLPDALLMLSGAMRAGASFNTALESMVKEQKPPLSQEFDLMVARAAPGRRSRYGAAAHGSAPASAGFHDGRGCHAYLARGGRQPGRNPRIAGQHAAPQERNGRQDPRADGAGEDGRASSCPRCRC